MATVDLTYDYSGGGNAALSAIQGGKCYVIERVVDVPTLMATGGLKTTTKITADEMIGVLPIPAYTLVTWVGCRIVTAGTGSATIDIGDGADEKGWDAAVAIDAAAGTQTATVHGTDAYAVLNGKLYTSADTIDVQFNADTTTGKFIIQAVCFDLSSLND
jgi:hypothetical protein